MTNRTVLKHLKTITDVLAQTDPEEDEFRAVALLRILDALSKLEIDPQVLAACWETKASTENIRAAVDLISAAATVLVTASLRPRLADSGAWARVQRARAVLSGLDGDQARRRMVLRHVRHVVAMFAVPLGANADDEDRKHLMASQKLWANILCATLADVDVAFASLEASFALQLLRRARPSDQVRKGGAGVTAPPLLAARLSVRVGAFGDDDEAKAKKRFLEAERSARG